MSVIDRSSERWGACDRARRLRAVPGEPPIKRAYFRAIGAISGGIHPLCHVATHHAPVAAHHSWAVQSKAVHSRTMMAHHSRATTVLRTVTLSGIRPVAARFAGQPVAIRREGTTESCPWSSAPRIDVALATNKPGALGVERQCLYGPRGERACHCSNPHHEYEPSSGGEECASRIFQHDYSLC